MFESLKTILIGVGVLVVIWLLLVLSWIVAIAITESHSQSVTDGSLVKKYEAFLKKFNCKFQLNNFVRNNAEEYWEGNDLRSNKEEKERQAEEAEEKKRQRAIEDAKNFFRNEKPEEKEIRIASYFDCKGVIRTFEDLMAIKDPQDGDQYLFFNQDETADNYMFDPRNLGIRIKYKNGDWYVNFIRIDISDYDEVSVEVKYFEITEADKMLVVDDIVKYDIGLAAYIALKYIDVVTIVNLYIMNVYDDSMTTSRRIGAR